MLRWLSIVALATVTTLLVFGAVDFVQQKKGDTLRPGPVIIVKSVGLVRREFPGLYKHGRVFAQEKPEKFRVDDWVILLQRTRAYPGVISAVKDVRYGWYHSELQVKPRASPSR